MSKRVSRIEAEATPKTQSKADARVERSDADTAAIDAAWARRVLHIHKLAKTHSDPVGLKLATGTRVDGDDTFYRTEISKLDAKAKTMTTKKKRKKDAEPPMPLLEEEEEELESEETADEETASEETPAPKGKAGDDEDAMLLAIAKKAMPDMDIARLNLSRGQLLEMIAQKVGAVSAGKPVAAPPEASDDDEEEEEEEEEGSARGDSIFAARARAEGQPGRRPYSGRSFEDARADMNFRVFNAWRFPNQEAAAAALEQQRADRRDGSSPRERTYDDVQYALKKRLSHGRL